MDSLLVFFTLYCLHPALLERKLTGSLKPSTSATTVVTSKNFSEGTNVAIIDKQGLRRRTTRDFDTKLQLGNVLQLSSYLRNLLTLTDFF